MSLRASRVAAAVLALALASCKSTNDGSGTGSGVTIDPTTLSFAADRNGPLPAAQSIHVTVSDSSAYYVVAGYPPGVAVPNWLTPSFTGSGTSWTLVVAIGSTALDPATYTTTLRIGIAKQDQTVLAYRDAQITYVVSNAGLTASPASLSFTQVIGGPTPLTQNVGVGGPVGQAWTASANQTWVVLGAISGTTGSPVSVGVNATGLAAGTYTARITFSGGSRTAPVDVTFRLDAPAIQASQTSLSFSGVNGAPIAGQALVISLNNGAAAPWSATDKPTWLVLSKPSGTTPETLTVSVDPSLGSLASGAYDSTVTFTSPSLPTVTVNVHLGLTKAAFSFQPTTLVLGGADGKTLGPQSLKVSLNTGSSAHDWTVIRSDNWMFELLPGSTSSAGVLVDVRPDPAGLTGATRLGSLDFSSNINGDLITASVPVTFNLEAHKLLVAARGVAFTKTPALSSLTRTIQVSDNFAAATSWTASSDQGWLSVTPRGTGSGSLVLTADPTGLTADTTYLAKVSLATTDTTVEQSDTVQVGLWVGSVTPGPVSASGSFTEMVADPVRPFAYVHTGGSTLSVYNVHTGDVATVSSVGTALGAMTVSSDGSTLFVVDRTNFNVVPVDLATRGVGAPWSLATTANSAPKLAYLRTAGLGLVAVADGKLHAAADGSVLFGFADPSGMSPATLVAASLDGSAFCVGACRSLRYSALGGGTFSTTSLSGSGGSHDSALAQDGKHVYGASGAPYNCTAVDTATGLSTDLGSNYPYPGNVEVGPDGRIYCGRYSTVSGDKDVYVFDAAGTQIGLGLRLAGTSGLLNLLDRQLAISGDGLRVIGLDPGLEIVTAP